MKYTDLTEKEVKEVVEKYVEYYNENEESCWTFETAYTRIHQVMAMPGAKCLVQYDDNGNMTGYVMGYFKQFDDILGYYLDEIVVFSGYQGKGYGSLLMEELQKVVAKNGAVYMELQSVDDEQHMHFYKKAGFYESENFTMMSKFWDNPEEKQEDAVEVKEVTDPAEKQKITRSILEALTDWFGIEESREEYISGCADKPYFAAFIDGKPVGFISLKETGKSTAEIYVMGVLKEQHRGGIGRKLFNKLKEKATYLGYSFLQVKTVQMGKYDDYDDTNRFYISLGFKEFEVFPLLWDEWNPCQIYVMAL